MEFKKMWSLVGLYPSGSLKRDSECSVTLREHKSILCAIRTPTQILESLKKAMEAMGLDKNEKVVLRVQQNRFKEQDNHPDWVLVLSKLDDK